jgi:hypothetical protein
MMQESCHQEVAGMVTFLDEKNIFSVDFRIGKTFLMI